MRRPDPRRIRAPPITARCFVTARSQTAVSWVTHERTPAPDVRFILYPRVQIPSVQSSLDELRKLRNHPLVHKTRDVAERHPRRTLAATAAGAVAVAGIATGLAAGGSAQPAHQFSHATAISQVSGSHTDAGQQAHQVTRTMQKTTDSAKSGHAAPAKHAAPSGPTKPYLVYDSVTPSSIPSNRVAAVYATGGFAASPSQVSGHPSVVWIDTNGSDPKASALDVEPGDATPSQAASWARAGCRLARTAWPASTRCARSGAR